MEGKQQSQKFDVELTMKLTEQLLKKYQDSKEMAFDQFFQILNQFCKAFKLINTFLGIAFSDVKDKIKVMNENNVRFPGHAGFFSFIKFEMEKNIVMYNVGNNKELKAPEEFKDYDSTGRNLLRMMWLLTFIKVTFEGMRDMAADMSDIMCKAYDAAFGENHSFIVRNGAKLAIKASASRKNFVEVISGQKYDEETFAVLNNKYMTFFVPVHEAFWNFYKENKLTELP